MSFIIFDTEFTSWKGCLENGRAEWQKEELVQIAALKVELSSFKVVDEFNTYIKPVLNPVLSDYFIELTGITNEKIAKEGIDFKDAYNDFYEFSKTMACFSHGWGNFYEDEISENMKISDGVIINKNLEFNNMVEDFHFNYKNIAFWFKKMYIKHGIKVECQASGEIASILGVENNIEKLGIGPHNALYDVYSILEGIKHFKGEGLEDYL